MPQVTCSWCHQPIEVQPVELKPGKNGQQVFAKCPLCQKPSTMSIAAIAAVLGVDEATAKAWKAAKKRIVVGAPPEEGDRELLGRFETMEQVNTSNVVGGTMTDEQVQGQGQAQVTSEGAGCPIFPHSTAADPTNWTTPATAVNPVTFTHPGQAAPVEDVQLRGQPEIRERESLQPFETIKIEEILEKGCNDVLKATLKKFNLEPGLEKDIGRYLDMRHPNGICDLNREPGREERDTVISLIERFSIPKMGAARIADRFITDLQMFLTERQKALGIQNSILGAPAPAMPAGMFAPPGQYGPAPSPFPGGYGMPAPTPPPYYPAPPAQPIPYTPQQQQLYQAYQANPAGFQQRLMSDPTLAALWNQLQMIMQQNQQILAQQSQQQQYYQAPQRTAPRSEAEFNRMLAIERERTRKEFETENRARVLEEEILRLRSAPPQQGGNETLMQVVLALIAQKGNGSQVPPAPQVVQPQTDPRMEKLMDAAIAKLMGGPNEELTRVLRELEDVKKKVDESGGSGPKTRADFLDWIEGVKVFSDIGNRQAEHEAKNQQREMVGNIVHKGIETFAGTIEALMSKQAQPGATTQPQESQPGMAAPQVVTGVATPETNQYPCPDCSTIIVFPKGATQVRCPNPKCGSVFDVAPIPQPTALPAPAIPEDMPPVQFNETPDQPSVPGQVL